jgi:hypothetical protein
VIPQNSDYWLESMAKPVDPTYTTEVDPALIERIHALVADISTASPSSASVAPPNEEDR